MARWLGDYRRCLEYRAQVAELLADARLDPADFNEAETDRVENAVKRCYFKRRPRQDAVTVVLAATGRR